MERILSGERAEDALAVAFCGATDNGPFMDMLVDAAWEQAQSAKSIDEACQSVRTSIKNTYREYGQIYQPGYLPNVELIYGVKMNRQSKLFYALGPAITEQHGVVSGGIGAYLADFICSRMHDQNMSIRQLIILAVYVLFQAKEHVEGCGGDSHIAVLRNEGTSGRIHFEHVESLTDLLKESDKQLGEVLVHCADLSLDKHEFRKEFERIQRVLSVLRERGRTGLRAKMEFYKAFFGHNIHDDMGLPTPSDVQKSED